MKTVFTFSCLLFLFTALSTALFAEANPASIAPCDKTSILGEWDSVRVVVKGQLKQIDPYGFQFQRWLFTKDGKTKHFSSSKPIDSNGDAFYQMLPLQNHYQINSAGNVLVSSHLRQTDLFGCFQARIDAPEAGMHRGDIVLIWPAPPKFE